LARRQAQGRPPATRDSNHGKQRSASESGLHGHKPLSGHLSPKVTKFPYFLKKATGTGIVDCHDLTALFRENLMNHTPKSWYRS
jgi:hypothetical protein